MATDRLGSTEALCEAIRNAPPGTITEVPADFDLSTTYTPPRPPEMPAEEFILWLSGAMDVLDGAPPTQEQWDKVRERMSQQVARIVARRMREAAEPHPPRFVFDQPRPTVQDVFGSSGHGIGPVTQGWHGIR